MNVKSKKAEKYVRQSESEDAWEAARSKRRRIEEDVSIPATGIRRVQLLCIPTFSQPCAWDIREEDEALSSFESQVVFEGNEPCLIGYRALDVPAPELRAFFTRLKQVSLSISPLFNGMVGRDGVLYHVALFGDFKSEVRFVWWSEAPEQWSELTKLVEDMVGVLWGHSAESA